MDILNTNQIIKKISGRKISLQAFKKAEDGIGYIMRLYNGSYNTATAVVTSDVLAFQIEVELKSTEFETYRITDGEVFKVDLIERRIGS